MTKASRTRGLYENVKEDLYYMPWVTKEGIAKRYGVREHEAANVLFMLNLEGFVHQPEHKPCPDTQIHKMKGNRRVLANKCWHRDVYVSRVFRDREGRPSDP
jgi:hypothetical protein